MNIWYTIRYLYSLERECISPRSCIWGDISHFIFHKTFSTSLIILLCIVIELLRASTHYILLKIYVCPFFSSCNRFNSKTFSCDAHCILSVWDLVIFCLAHCPAALWGAKNSSIDYPRSLVCSTSRRRKTECTIQIYGYNLHLNRPEGSFHCIPQKSWAHSC